MSSLVDAKGGGGEDIGNISPLFLHISDLHTGTVDGEPDAWEELYEGLRGHDRESISQLKLFYYNIINKENREPRIIVTGDLTRCGMRKEYSDYEGLFPIVQRSRDLVIPGNHDHWPGLPWPFGSPEIKYTDFLDECPSVEKVVSIPGIACLRFITINSYVDVYQPMDRFLARGSFTSDLNKASLALKQLRPREANGSTGDEIRVLILHHSLEYGCIIQSNGSLAQKPWVNSILNDCIERLEEFIIEHDIKVLLTGHIHEPVLTPITFSRNGRVAEIFEARCGTTTQRKNSGRNTLLTHEITKHGTSRVWRSSLYRRGDEEGFVLKRVREFPL